MHNDGVLFESKQRIELRKFDSLIQFSSARRQWECFGVYVNAYQDPVENQTRVFETEGINLEWRYGFHTVDDGNNEKCHRRRSPGSGTSSTLTVAIAEGLRLRCSLGKLDYGLGPSFIVAGLSEWCKQGPVSAQYLGIRRGEGYFQKR